MVARILLAAIVVLLSTCAAPGYGQSVVGQTSLRARLPFSGANQPASLQSAVKSQPRPSTSGDWSYGRMWGAGPGSPSAVYRPAPPWLPPSSSIVPTGTIAEDYSWMDGWENDQAARSRANDASMQGILDAMSTRPSTPWLVNPDSQSNAYPVTFEPSPPIAQPNAASATMATPSEGAVSTPSQPLSVPSAATSAPIPY